MKTEQKFRHSTKEQYPLVISQEDIDEIVTIAGDMTKLKPEIAKFRTMLSGLTGGKLRVQDTPIELNSDFDGKEVPGKNPVDILANSGNARLAWGVMSGDGITIYNGAKRGVIYHEAFHRIFRFYLTDAEQRMIVDEVMNLHPEFKTFEEVNEYLAERFRSYILDGGSTVGVKGGGRIMTFFRSLAQFVKQFVFNIKPNVENIDQLFKAIDTGNYRYVRANQKQINDFVNQNGVDPLLILDAKGDVMSYFKSHSEFDGVISSLAAKTLELNGIVNIDSLTTGIDYQYTFNYIRQAMEEVARKIPFIRKSNIRESLQEKMIERIKNIIGGLLEIEKHFAEGIAPLIDERLRNSGFKNTTERIADDENIEGDISSLFLGGQLKASYEVSAKDTAPSNIKLMFMSLRKSSKKTVYGMDEMLQFNEAWYRAMHELHDSSSVADMMDRIDRMAELDIMASIAEGKQDNLNMWTEIRDRLSQNNDQFDTLKTQLYATFKKHRHSFINYLWNDKNEVIIYDADITKRTKQLITQWSANFAENFKPDEDYYKKWNAIRIKYSREDANAESAVNEIVQFFNDIGVTIDSSVINYTISTLDGNDNNSRIKHLLGGTGSENGIINIPMALSYLQTNLESVTSEEIQSVFRRLKFLKPFAENEIKVNPTNEDDSVFGAGGGLVYAFAENNHISQTFGEFLKDREYRNKLISENINKIRNRLGVESTNSQFLKQIGASGFNMNEMRVLTMLSMIEGNSGDMGRDYTNISEKEDLIAKITSQQRGYVQVPVMADKKTYYFIQGLKTICQELRDSDQNIVWYNDQTGSATLHGKIIDTFYEYAVGEYLACISAEKERNDFMAYASQHAKEIGWTEEDLTIDDFNAMSYTEQEEFNHSFLTENYHYTLVSDPVTGKKKMNLSKGNGYGFRYFKGLSTDMFPVSTDPQSTIKQKIDSIKDLIGKNLAKNINNDILDLANIGLLTLEKGQLDNSARTIGTIDGKLAIKSSVIPSNVVKNYNRGKDQPISKTEIMLNIIAENTISSIQSTIEFDKVVCGDVAFYKNEDDRVKRLAAMISTGTATRIDFDESHELYNKNNYRQWMIADNIIDQEESFNNLVDKYVGTAENPAKLTQDALDKGYTIDEAMGIARGKAAQILSGLRNNNQTDGGAYTTPEFYRSVSIRIGEWSEKKEAAYKRLMDEDLDQHELEMLKDYQEIALQPLKMMYFARQLHNGTASPKYDKPAFFTIFPKMAVGTDLGTMLDSMHANEVDVAIFNSATKTGLTQKQDLYSKDQGSFLPGFNFTIEDKYIEDREFRYLRKQLNTDAHAIHDRSLGTQAGKIAISGLNLGSLDYLLDGQQVTGQTLLDSWREAMNELTARGAIKFDKSIGWDTEDGTFNQAKFYEFFKEAAQGAGKAKSISDSFTFKDGKAALHPAAYPQTNWIHSRILSKFKKTVINTNTAGGELIQMSSFAITNKDITAISEPKRGHNPSKLGYFVEGNKQEVSVSTRIYKQFFPSDKVYNEMTHEQRVEFIMSNPELTMLGYRIPTQGKNSTLALQVKTLLPDEVGNLIVLPAEFTTLTGSDFDINKLFFAMYNYESGVIEIKDDSVRDRIEQDYQEYRDRMLKNLKLTDMPEKTIKLLYGEETDKRKEWAKRHAENVVWRGDRWMYYERNTMYKIHYDSNIPESQNSTEALQNRLIDIYLAALTSEAHIVETSTPLDRTTEPLYKARDWVELSQGDKEKYMFSSANSKFWREVRSRNLGAAKGIGSMALHNSHHAMTIMAGVTINTNWTFTKHPYRNFVSIFGMNSLSNTKDIDDVSIMDWTSALINAHVDAAKDPYIYAMNVNSFTYDATSLMIRSGMGESTFYFMPQDILKELSTEYNSLFGGKYGSNEKLKYKDRWIKNIRDKYIKLRNDKVKAESGLDDFAEGARILGINKQWTNQATIYGTKDNKPYLLDKHTLIALMFGYAPTDMYGNITMVDFIKANEEKILNGSIKISPVKAEDRSANFYNHQLHILDAFQDIYAYGKDLASYVRLAQVDTAKYGKSATQLQAFLRRYNQKFGEGQKNPMFFGMDRVYDNTHIRNKLVELEYLQYKLGTELLEFSPGFADAVDAILTMTKNDSLSNEQALNAIAKNLKCALTLGFFDKCLALINVTKESLFIGKSSLAVEFLELKKKADTSYEASWEALSENPIFKVLSKSTVTSADSEKYGIPMLLNANSFKYRDDVAIEDMINGWRDLLDNKDTRRFAIKLIAYAMYTTGGNKSIDDFIPPEILGKISNGEKDEFGNKITYNDFIKSEINRLQLKDIDIDVIERVIVSLKNNDFVVKNVGYFVEVEGESYIQSVYVDHTRSAPKSEYSKGLPQVIVMKPDFVEVHGATTDGDAGIPNIEVVIPRLYIKFSNNSVSSFNKENVLYRYVGSIINESGQQAVYEMVNSLGYYKEGYNLHEENVEKSIVKSNHSTEYDYTNYGEFIYRYPHMFNPSTDKLYQYSTASFSGNIVESAESTTDTENQTPSTSDGLFSYNEMNVRESVRETAFQMMINDGASVFMENEDGTIGVSSVENPSSMEDADVVIIERLPHHVDKPVSDELQQAITERISSGLKTRFFISNVKDFALKDFIKSAIGGVAIHEAPKAPKQVATTDGKVKQPMKNDSISSAGRILHLSLMLISESIGL